MSMKLSDHPIDKSTEEIHKNIETIVKDQMIPQKFRVFKVLTSDQSFDIIMVAPSPKFPGKTSISVFYSTFKDYTTNGQAETVFVPFLDITLILNQNKNIRYPNNSKINIGDTIETTCSSVDQWLNSYKNTMNYEQFDIVEMTLDELVVFDPQVMLLYGVKYQKHMLNPERNKAEIILSDEQINKAT